MMLPKLTEYEYEEIYEDFDEIYEEFLWFISISGNFFDNMYGNICKEDK